MTKSGPYLRLKGVDKLNKYEGKVILLVEYEHGARCWIPQDFLNKAAQEMYLEGDPDIPEQRYNLRSRDLGKLE